MKYTKKLKDGNFTAVAESRETPTIFGNEKVVDVFVREANKRSARLKS